MQSTVYGDILLQSINFSMHLLLLLAQVTLQPSTAISNQSLGKSFHKFKSLILYNFAPLKLNIVFKDYMIN